MNMQDILQANDNERMPGVVYPSLVRQWTKEQEVICLEGQKRQGYTSFIKDIRKILTRV